MYQQMLHAIIHKNKKRLFFVDKNRKLCNLFWNCCHCNVQKRSLYIEKLFCLPLFRLYDHSIHQQSIRLYPISFYRIYSKRSYRIRRSVCIIDGWIIGGRSSNSYCLYHQGFDMSRYANHSPYICIV